MASQTDIACVKLVRPINVEDRIITEVNIRRPKVRDPRAMEKIREPGGTELDQGFAMAAALYDLPLEAMDEMDAVDFAAVSEALGGVLPKGPARAAGAASRRIQRMFFPRHWPPSMIWIGPSCCSGTWRHGASQGQGEHQAAVILLLQPWGTSCVAESN